LHCTSISRQCNREIAKIFNEIKYLAANLNNLKRQISFKIKHLGKDMNVNSEGLRLKKFRGDEPIAPHAACTRASGRAV
jgi:hypothetical protein